MVLELTIIPKHPSPVTIERLVQRAVETYLAGCSSDAPLPVSADSRVVRQGRRRFVVLRKAERILAVYRLSSGGQLNRLE